MCLFFGKYVGHVLQAAEAESDALVARNLARSWHSVLEAAFDAEVVCQMYNRAAQLCMKTDATGYAQDVLKQAQLHGLDLDSHLQTEVLVPTEEPFED